MQIHRFHNSAAISLAGTGETRYMTPEEAERVGRGLLAIAESIRREEFSAAPCLDVGFETFADTRELKRAAPPVEKGEPVHKCPACGEDHALGEEAESAWQQWQCAACGSWNDWSADALEAKATAICKAQPGYGTPSYRGDPYDAVALQQEANLKRGFVSTDVLERYDAGTINDEEAIAELEDRGWTRRRAAVILEEHKAS